MFSITSHTEEVGLISKNKKTELHTAPIQKHSALISSLQSAFQKVNESKMGRHLKIPHDKKQNTRKNLTLYNNVQFEYDVLPSWAERGRTLWPGE